MSDKIACFAKLTAQPGKGDELIAVFTKLFETVEQESGTEVYVLHRDNKDPDTVWFYELYTDKPSLDAHGGSPGMKEAIGALAGLVAGPPELHFATPQKAKGTAI